MTCLDAFVTTDIFCVFIHLIFSSTRLHLDCHICFGNLFDD